MAVESEKVRSFLSSLSLRSPTCCFEALTAARSSAARDYSVLYCISLKRCSRLLGLLGLLGLLRCVACERSQSSLHGCFTRNRDWRCHGRAAVVCVQGQQAFLSNQAFRPPRAKMVLAEKKGDVFLRGPGRAVSYPDFMVAHRLWGQRFGAFNSTLHLQSPRCNSS